MLEEAVLMTGDHAYGLWPLVILNTGLFVLFAASFSHPRTRRDWRAMGAFTAFLVALFTEMYGVPLTVYLLSSWLGDPHLSPFHLTGYLAIGGFWLISAAWRVLWEATLTGRLATTGPYARIRHPRPIQPTRSPATGGVTCAVFRSPAATCSPSPAVSRLA
jgi:protein-S-isoprenylcysteine O-methyltransferase Ste14